VDVAVWLLPFCRVLHVNNFPPTCLYMVNKLLQQGSGLAHTAGSTSESDFKGSPWRWT
jgi:hypothetical protein